MPASFHSKQVHWAVIETAKMLEEEPWRYSFFHGKMTDAEEHDKACPLIWIGHFLGPHPAFHYAKDVATTVMMVSKQGMHGIPEDAFYKTLHGYFGGPYWLTHAYHAATALRTFAARELA